MNIFNNFLCKIFGVITLLFCYTVCGYAEEDTTIIKVICNAGYYVSSCGTKTIGTNWLKGIHDNTETPDYFSYNSAAYDNLTNLRKFFAGHDDITYTDKNGSTQTVTKDTYTGYRNTIFEKFCIKTTDDNPQELTTHCERCPNNAQVPQSTIGFNVTNNTFNLSKYMYIYTIADCYVEEFSDHTGTFIYSAANNTNAKKCYYSNNIEGDELISE